MFVYGRRIAFVRALHLFLSFCFCFFKLVLSPDTIWYRRVSHNDVHQCTGVSCLNSRVVLFVRSYTRTHEVLDFSHNHLRHRFNTFCPILLLLDGYIPRVCPERKFFFRPNREDNGTPRRGIQFSPKQAKSEDKDLAKKSRRNRGSKGLVRGILLSIRSTM
ncbi:unnamed protein product [Trichogramma brassicae]|uniref:Uncharacterized protein n=1 Tax=Trichogramma brassicae TaxID=86971 RepID=A0A6H5IXJ6_9HYME|nr:unnamed protein product [Trichogramma brassicae]